MTTGNSPALPPEEQARRRNLVASADWSCRMEGLGKPSAERVALDESWITGQISRDEYEARAFALVRERIDLAQIRALQARAKAKASPGGSPSTRRRCSWMNCPANRSRCVTALPC